jgi:hypothetical protein
MSSEDGAPAPHKSVVAYKPDAKRDLKAWARSVKRAAKRFSKKVLGWLMIALGFVCLGAGFLLIIIPGHYFLILVGLMLILRNAYWARRQFIHLKRRHPNWVMPLRKLLRRNPQVVSIFWQQVLKFERMILRGRGQLVGIRRRFLRKPRTV